MPYIDCPTNKVFTAEISMFFLGERTRAGSGTAETIVSHFIIICYENIRISDKRCPPNSALYRLDLIFQGGGNTPKR